MEENHLAKHDSLDAQPARESVNLGAEYSAASSNDLPDNFISPTQPEESKTPIYAKYPRRPKWARRLTAAVKTFLEHVTNLVFAERINILLVFVPIGIVVGLADLDPGVDFVLNALAIVPLAVVISTATESLASRLGDKLGALLNVTVGNAAELMIFFVALSKDQIGIVQASLLGSILANSLLVLGTAFLVG